MALITVITMQHVRIVLVHLNVLVTLDIMGMARPVLVWQLLNVMYTIIYAYYKYDKYKFFLFKLFIV